MKRPKRTDSTTSSPVVPTPPRLFRSLAFCMTLLLGRPRWGVPAQPGGRAKPFPRQLSLKQLGRGASVFAGEGHEVGFHRRSRARAVAHLIFTLLGELRHREVFPRD